MYDAAAIEEKLQISGLNLASRVVASVEDPSQFFAFVFVRRSEKNLQIPSHRDLQHTQEELALTQIRVSFILIDAMKRDEEAGLRATLFHCLGDSMRDAFVAIKGRSADVWIIPKASLHNDEMRVAKERAKVFLENIDISLASISSIDKQKLPSKTACLYMLRRVAPISIETFYMYVERRGFIVPSPSWLSKSLDSLRKSGFVIRMKDGSYALTLDGLRASGTSKNAKSPDVQRLLDLARRVD